MHSSYQRRLDSLRFGLQSDYTFNMSKGMTFVQQLKLLAAILLGMFLRARMFGSPHQWLKGLPGLKSRPASNLAGGLGEPGKKEGGTRLSFILQRRLGVRLW